MTENNDIIRFPTVVGLPTFKRSDYSQLAILRLLEFRVDLLKEVPLYELHEEDLSGEEFTKRQECANAIISWLKGYGSDVQGLQNLPYLWYPRSSKSMIELRQLLKKVHDRKTENARQAKEQADHVAATEATEKRVGAAIKTIDPPVEEAKRLLSSPEYKHFEESIGGAIDAVIQVQGYGDDQSNAWLEETSAYDYRYWVSVIQEREKEQKQRQQAARLTEIAVDVITTLRTAAVEKLQDKLARSKKPSISYTPELSGYNPEKWCEIGMPDEKQIETWATGEIKNRVPLELKNIVGWKNNYEIAVIPHAWYEINNDIPSLRWDFTALVLVTTYLKLGECVLCEQNPGYKIIIQGNNRQLGIMYIHASWKCNGNFSTPVILLKLLAEGRLEGPGVVVTGRTGHMIEFLVSGVAKVKINDNFIEFVKYLGKKSAPFWQSLYKAGLIDKQVADLLKEKCNQSLPHASQGSPPGEADLDTVIGKLIEMGWTVEEAKDKVKKIGFHAGSSVEAILKSILGSDSG